MIYCWILLKYDFTNKTWKIDYQTPSYEDVKSHMESEYYKYEEYARKLHIRNYKIKFKLVKGF